MASFVNKSFDPAFFKMKSMKQISKLYLKTFLLKGLPFGLIMTGFDLLAGDGFKFWKFLFLTCSFGITMSLILVPFYKYRLKKNEIQELSDENLGVTQSNKIKRKLNNIE